MKQTLRGADAGAILAGQPARLAALGVALLVSAAVLWLITQQVIPTIAFLCGLLVLAAAGFAVSRMPANADDAAFAAPDWSVTVTAIEQPGIAIAITDRANRLTCANALYAEWFGANHAPPSLAVDRAGLEALAIAARQAWRDGSGVVARLESAGGHDIWRAHAERAGRGDDYLVWRFELLRGEDIALTVAGRLAGPFGALLSRAGIEAALVGADGIIRAANQGFAERAAGDGSATMAGQEYAAQLRIDERDQIFFARDTRRASPQTLIQIPLDDPDKRGVSTGFDAKPSAAGGRANVGEDAPSLMLLIDGGVGLGGNLDGPGQAATPQLEALLGALPLGLAMTDRDGRFLFANSAFLRAIDLEDAGLPQFPSDLVVREDKAALSDAVRRFGRGPGSNGDMAVRLLSQPDEPVSLGLAGVRGLGEAAVLLSLADSTEETRLKRQIAQATKMQAVGQLAGGVAHDFNNVLTAIIGYCDLMLLRHTPGDSDYDDIQQIRANSNRAASLTRQLLAFSRQQTLRPEVVQLPDIVSEVSQLLKRLVGEKITFTIRHDRDLGPVRADPQQLEQVIVNLAVNARDAINANGDGTGKLTLSTRRVSASDVRKAGSDIIPVADYTVMVVQDSGGGIPPELLGKIFEPFFTTKEQGKGTGLGLSTVYGIVKQSGGFIFADNIKGLHGRPDGARFTIYLPVHHGEPVDTSKPVIDQKASKWSGGGRLLLVEDEAMVRAVAERALTRAGYAVTTASDGEEGLAEIVRGGEFDLIVSDVVMPGMDGPTMAREIRAINRALPVLFMSGYAEEQLRRDIDIDNMYFIPKPFSVQQISDKVGSILGLQERLPQDK
ncbi:hybrid sensor histidine kinase/response regulator [Allopontixanthobacter sediminis]|uniref:histidine kinase n=1 Tax=Allopontixanthobacter sediminis TaxID=1689985 RepID=A0A845AZN6_9SPHN|nr:response regulator [Allopontixanthobacter sediminis]MXP43344.1 response regulator [Allopontixanthobacter sediminis]